MQGITYIDTKDNILKLVNLLSKFRKWLGENKHIPLETAIVLGENGKKYKRKVYNLWPMYDDWTGLTYFETFATPKSIYDVLQNKDGETKVSLVGEVFNTDYIADWKKFADEDKDYWLIEWSEIAWAYKIPSEIFIELKKRAEAVGLGNWFLWLVNFLDYTTEKVMGAIDEKLAEHGLKGVHVKGD